MIEVAKLPKIASPDYPPALPDCFLENHLVKIFREKGLAVVPKEKQVQGVAHGFPFFRFIVGGFRPAKGCFPLSIGQILIFWASPRPRNMDSWPVLLNEIDRKSVV